MTSTVSEKGWIVIPKDIRERYGLKKGTKVSVIDYGGTICVLPVPDDPIREGLGLIKNVDGEDILQRHLDEKRAEAKLEDLSFEQRYKTPVQGQPGR